MQPGVRNPRMAANNRQIRAMISSLTLMVMHKLSVHVTLRFKLTLQVDSSFRPLQKLIHAACNSISHMVTVYQAERLTRTCPVYYKFQMAIAKNLYLRVLIINYLFTSLTRLPTPPSLHALCIQGAI